MQIIRCRCVGRRHRRWIKIWCHHERSFGVSRCSEEREREPSIWPPDGPETFQTSVLTRWACTRPHRGAGKFSWPKKQDNCSCVWMRCLTFILHEVIFARTWFSSTKPLLRPTMIRGTNFFQSIIAHLSSEGVTWKTVLEHLFKWRRQGVVRLATHKEKQFVFLKVLIVAWRICFYFILRSKPSKLFIYWGWLHPLWWVLTNECLAGWQFKHIKQHVLAALRLPTPGNPCRRQPFLRPLPSSPWNPPIKLPAADSSVSNSSLNCWKTVTQIFTVFCCSRWRYRDESVHSSCLKNVSPVWTCVANLMSFNASLVSCANCALPVCF